MSIRAAIALVLTLSIPGCGPSLRRTYQSDNAFARCFDMDYNPTVSAEEKQVCWDRFLDRYVYNQPHDKIAYAELRLGELSKGISVPGPPGPPGAFHERPEPPPDSGRRGAPHLDAGVSAPEEQRAPDAPPETPEPEEPDASVP
jgi:hypothetical protein